MRLWVLIYLCVVVSGGINYAQNNWAKCGTDGNLCHVSNIFLQNINGSDHDIRGRILARYGSGSQWSYRKFYVNVFECSASNFGNPCNGFDCGTKICQYRHINDYYLNVPYNQVQFGSYKAGETVNNIDDNIYRLEYADGRVATNIFGKVIVQVGLFYKQPVEYYKGNLNDASGKIFSYYRNISLTSQYSKWNVCAEEGQICYFPNTFNIFSVSFGSGWLGYTTAGIIREWSGNGVMCSTSSFPDINVYGNDYPSNKRYCAYSIDTQFSEPTGYWKLVSSCLNCKLQETLVLGVSSTNQESTTESWTDALTMTTQSGVKFKVFSNTETLTSQQSHSVSDTSMHAFSQTSSKSCSASCGSDSGPSYLYQWMLDVNENCQEVTCLTHIYTCVFLCKQTPSEPACIPGECADSECDKCIK